MTRQTIACTLAACFCILASPAHAAPRSIAVVNCALIDDNAAYNDAELTRVQNARLGMISDELRDQLRSRELFRVADNAPAGKLIASLQASQDLNACNGCELEVGRTLGVDRVGVCWVQKISNLILNINLRVEDVATGKAVFQRSVDIRGNTDQSWRRGVKSLVDLLAADAGAR
ncbi:MULTISPECIES: DUF3280 domain-containing protein [unclassified Caballeronia]|uniref:DUF3280 domain-containing protein n=1 Tax=unclassified Caballeronia TaxID=2646786 RepID=UPI002857492E|nr:MULTISPECIES: DUF3280 domain-containing protein [unclassified Caballeronia]MDR5754399.1 DUF3280 domain-containing protein [Caballeronia sp. LZ024]MDR5840777.1 DUF3280 domain-containing protein [Caballeronia sp. LZ031]